MKQGKTDHIRYTNRNLRNIDFDVEQISEHEEGHLIMCIKGTGKQAQCQWLIASLFHFHSDIYALLIILNYLILSVRTVGNVVIQLATIQWSSCTIFQYFVINCRLIIALL